MRWDTGRWRNCFHFNPEGHGESSVERHMSLLAIRDRRYVVMWGVVNPGNAMCAAVFHTRREAREWRRDNASAYVVVRVAVTPLYTQNPNARYKELARLREAE